MAGAGFLRNPADDQTRHPQGQRPTAMDFQICKLLFNGLSASTSFGSSDPFSASDAELSSTVVEFSELASPPLAETLPPISCMPSMPSVMPSVRAYAPSLPASPSSTGLMFMVVKYKPPLFLHKLPQPVPMNIDGKPYGITCKADRAFLKVIFIFIGSMVILMNVHHKSTQKPARYILCPVSMTAHAHRNARWKQRAE